ncbi:hypothetical protein SDC9_189440 [bioreactor metagenome]|uniref:Uncharacterized protein n=1 Tax=bioreactor metagenome TaxID=1076179 RepID=A0A645HS62_9ZZZZ
MTALRTGGDGARVHHVDEQSQVCDVEMQVHGWVLDKSTALCVSLRFCRSIAAEMPHWRLVWASAQSPSRHSSYGVGEVMSEWIAGAVPDWLPMAGAVFEVEGIE